MKTVSIQTRVPKKMKLQAKKVFERLGLDFSTATRIFYAQVIKMDGIPFLLTIKNMQPTSQPLTKEEEKRFWREAAERSFGELWNRPEDDIWDDLFKKLPSIDTP